MNARYATSVFHKETLVPARTGTFKGKLAISKFK
jgi:hypothetical protein